MIAVSVVIHLWMSLFHGMKTNGRDIRKSSLQLCGGMGARLPQGAPSFALLM